MAAYFVCAEALANASKHAQASRVDITGAPDGGVLRITVTDDGIGGADPSGSGLRGLRDRFAVLGGVARRTRAPGGGTVVTATVPATAVSGEPAAAVSRPA